MKCANHMEKDAVAVCNHCGKSICPDCQAQYKGENYCRDCIAIAGTGSKKQEHSPAIAAILSFVVAGLGQIYNGQVGKGILIFLTSWLIVPWIIGIVDAYRTAKKINLGEMEAKKKTGCLIAFVVGIVIMWIVIAIIALLAAIAIPNLLRARMAANENNALQVLKDLSVGIEDYKVKNNTYPADIGALGIKELPSFEGYNRNESSAYDLSGEFRVDGYALTARPKECGVSATKIFRIQTGGAMNVEACKEINNKEEN